MSERADHVLVADPIEGVARLQEHWLEAAGYAVSTATSVEDLGEVPTADVVVIDRTMCGDTGERLAEEASNAPRIVLTSAADSGLELAARSFDEYLTKPLAKPELTTAVDRVLARQTYDRAVEEFASVVTRVALVRRDTTAAERAASDDYRSLVERCYELRARTASTVDALDEEELRAVFGDGERVALARRPGSVLDVQPTER